MCIYVPKSLIGCCILGKDQRGPMVRERRISGHAVEASNGKRRSAVLTHVVSSCTHIPCICLSRIVAVSCPKEITKAATLWTDTSSARPATLPASGCSPPKPAPTFKYGRLLSWLVGGAEKKETQEKDKKRNGKIQERQSSRGIVSVLPLILTFL